MKRWLWILIAILISTSVYFTIRYGLRPKPIPVMNATEFENAEQIGAVIYRRMHQEIHSERILLLGSAADVPESKEVWTGFLKTALADQNQVAVLFVREGVAAPENIGHWQEIPFPRETTELVKQAKDHMLAGHLVVILAGTSEISHLIEASLSRQIDEETHHPVLALSTVDATLTPAELSKVQAECLSAVSTSEQRGVQRLECAEARVSRALGKKKTPSGHLWSTMERHGLKEYLIFVHR